MYLDKIEIGKKCPNRQQQALQMEVSITTAPVERWLFFL